MMLFSLSGRVLTVLCIAGLLIMAAPSTRAAKQLRWKMAQGDSFQVELTQEMKQVLTLGERTVEIPNTMFMSMTWTVDGIDAEGAIHMTQTIDRMKMTMRAPGMGEVQFDSAAKQEPEGLAKAIAGMMKPMVGAKFLQKMTDRGEILDLQVPKGALAGLAANPLLKQFFSDGSFKRMMTQSSLVLPEQAIEKGFRWQRTSENKTPVGTMKMAVTYRYEGEQERGGRALDEFSAQVALAFEKSESPQSPAIKITDQDNSGSLWFDAAAGHMAESEMAQKMTMAIAIGDRTIRQRIETKTKMTVRRGAAQ